MELLVVPPFTDFTTEIVPPPGAEVLDLGARIVERLADPARLRAATAHRRDGPHTALIGRSAAAVIEQAAYDTAHLRAVGAALRLAGDPALRLSIDGLELAEGSTQSSRDVLAAAARCELFRPEVEQAVEAAKERRAHVVVDGERQLPAAFALVRALGAERVTLCGRLVTEQVAALRRVPELAGAEWLAWAPERVIRPHWHGDGTPVRWVTGLGTPPAAGPWAGRLDATRVAAFPLGTLTRCRGLTIIVTRIDFLAAVTGLDGMTVNLRRLLAAIPMAAPVTCELAVGAPGFGAGIVGESLELLADGPGGVRLGGLRPYRMGIRTVWAGHSVRFPPPAGHDLTRWVEFDAPETMRAWEVANTIKTWRGRLHNLPPGRLAACTVTGDAPAPTWAPCAAGVLRRRV
ncbi:hypothetical protein ACU635_23620 [[Actinomadura] parvosata]|uniref:hypothetical protein n=1 Tax=[Actinomadura] parvosata TaxID=1955412 RepID=UPI00406CA2CD